MGFNLGINLPKFSMGGIGTWIMIIAILVIIIIGIAVVVWYYIQKKTYFIQIRDFENISGQGFQLVGRNTARLIKIGDGGEELLMLKKGKSYRTAYGKKMGKNEYWFCKGQDGYWYNVVLGDLDAKMGMLDIEPIDRDMRYMHVAIRKNIQDRYKSKDTISKYLPIVISFVFLVIILIALWFMMGKAGDMINAATTTVKAAQPIAEALNNAVSKLDTICSASGIRPA